MNEFPIIRANKKSISKRSKLCGVGINDADYIVRVVFDGKSISCPYYSVWASMIQRCYSKKYHKRKPTYIGCSVSEDWKIFSIFKHWMGKMIWNNKQLDKDILSPGNKIYNPNNCIFISNEINTLLNNCKSSRGIYPIGSHITNRLTNTWLP